MACDKDARGIGLAAETAPCFAIEQWLTLDPLTGRPVTAELAGGGDGGGGARREIACNGDLSRLPDLAETVDVGPT